MSAEMGQAPAVLSGGDVLITTLSCPVLIPPANRARAVPCLLCGQAIGAAPADQIVLWPVSASPCECGRSEVTAFLIHAAHPLPEPGEVTRLARARLKSHHR